MPRSAGDAAPREYLARGQWPDGDLRGDAPISAVYGQAFSVRLRKALAERGNPCLREVEREAGVSRKTVERTLRGKCCRTSGRWRGWSRGLALTSGRGRNCAESKARECVPRAESTWFMRQTVTVDPLLLSRNVGAVWTDAVNQWTGEAFDRTAPAHRGLVII